MGFDVKSLSWEGQESFAPLVVVGLRKRTGMKFYEQAKEMPSGLRTTTRTSVYGFPHADSAVKTRTHSARGATEPRGEGDTPGLC